MFVATEILRVRASIAMRRLVCTIAGMTAMNLFTSLGHARTWVVEADGSGDTPTIQAAILLADVGDTIEVGPGVYHETILLTGGRDIYLRSRLGPEVTILDGDGLHGVAHIDAGTLEGFTIRNGSALAGAGVAIGQAAKVTSPIVRNNIIEYNRAALYPDCCNGAGILNTAVGSRIEGNVIRYNHVEGAGGGILDRGAEAVIVNNLILGNTASISAGGLLSGFSFISQNLIVGNFARFTSGGAELEGCVDFRNNTVLENSTANGFNNASGVRLTRACGTAVGNIIVRNRGGGRGIGLVVVSAQSQVTCNDVWQNDIDDLPGNISAMNFSADPLFCAADPATSLNFLLRSSSPCAPGNAPIENCAAVGANGVGCGTVAVEQRRWGDVKRLFR